MITVLTILACLVIFYLIFFLGDWVAGHFPVWTVIPTMLLVVGGGIASIGVLLHAFIF